MDTKKTDSKIKKYLALAGGITTVVSGTNAQVVYTDVNPGYLLSGNLSVYPLDLNNDASPDFMLMTLDTLINYVYTSSSNIITYNFNVDAATINPGASSNGWLQPNSYPAALAQGAMIGSTGSFESSSSSFGYPLAGVVQQSVLYNGVPVYNYSDTVGNFQMDQEAILGLRLSEPSVIAIPNPPSSFVILLWWFRCPKSFASSRSSSTKSISSFSLPLLTKPIPLDK